jgi:hypothetical protein
MTPEQQERLKACLQEAASILYEVTEPKPETLEAIEGAVRDHLLNQVGPEIGNFLSNKSHKRSQGERGGSEAVSER